MQEGRSGRGLRLLMDAIKFRNQLSRFSWLAITNLHFRLASGLNIIRLVDAQLAVLPDINMEHPSQGE